MSEPTREQTIDVVSLRKSRELDRILEGGDSGTIGVYFDAEGTQCTGTITPEEPGRIYIIANMNGLTGCGVAAAEFRFQGIPDSWVTVSAPNPEMLAIGDPFANGVTCAFPCAQPESGKYVLYTVVVFATDEEDDLEFSLEMRNPPSSRYFHCPALLMCDTPYFTQLCVETIPCYVNTSATKSCEIPVAISHDTWSSVKALYR